MVRRIFHTKTSIDGWKKDWLEKNGFKWKADSCFSCEFECFSLEVRIEGGLFIAHVVPETFWSFSDRKKFKTPQEAVFHAVEFNRKFEKIVLQDDKLSTVQFI